MEREFVDVDWVEVRLACTALLLLKTEVQVSASRLHLPAAAGVGGKGA